MYGVPPCCGQLSTAISDFKSIYSFETGLQSAKTDKKTMHERRGRRGIYCYILKDKTPLYTPVPYKCIQRIRGFGEDVLHKWTFYILRSRGEPQ